MSVHDYGYAIFHFHDLSITRFNTKDELVNAVKDAGGGEALALRFDEGTQRWVQYDIRVSSI